MNLNKKLCDEWNMNKNINPITKKKIVIDGPTYKKIEKNCNKNKEDKKPKKEDKKPKKENKKPKKEDKKPKNICEEWLKNPNINPETGKTIKKNGVIYKKLLKLCEEKKNKSKTSSLSSHSSSSKKSVNSDVKEKKLCEEWLKNPSINPETGRKINIDGPKYNYFKTLCLKNKISNKSPSHHDDESSRRRKYSSYHDDESSRRHKSSSSYKTIASYITSSLDDEKLDKIKKENKDVKQKFAETMYDLKFDDKKLIKLIKSDVQLKKEIAEKLYDLNKIKSSPIQSNNDSYLINPFTNNDSNSYYSEEELKKEIEEEIKSQIIDDINKRLSSNEKIDKKDEKQTDDIFTRLYNMFNINPLNYI